jgi:mono/diheme cytochrome c family protein
MPRNLTDPAFQRSTADSDLTAAVRHGRAGMPALVPRVAEDDAVALTAFVRLLSPAYESYTRYCAACHGDDGRGAGSFAEATSRRPTVVFDRRYFERHDPEAVRAAVWHMVGERKPAMPHFRERLSEADARAVVEYLKRNE